MTYIFFFSGTVTKVAPGVRGEQGEAIFGPKYYEVKSNDEKINGCYKKINYHSLHPNSSSQYPIYQQAGGPFYLKIHVDREGAPWLFLRNPNKVIKYT